MLLGIWTWIACRTRDERGAAAVEYGLLVALIAVVIIGAVTALGGGVRGTFCNVTQSLGFGNPCATP